MNQRPNSPKVLGRLLYHVSELSRLAFSRAVTEYGFTPAQARAFLAMREPVPMRALAEEWSCDASNVTAIADALEKRGLIERIQGTDRRVRLLTLTEEGRQAQRELGRHVESSPFPTDVLTPEEQRQLTDLLADVLGRQP